MQPENQYIEDGLLVIQNGKVKETGNYKQLSKNYPGEIHDLGPYVVVPGLINAHTHLELSHLQGQTVLQKGFETWVKSLLQLPMQDIDTETLQKTVNSLEQNGTAGMGDISGHSPRTVLQSLQESRAFYRVFLEFLGFKPPKTDNIDWPTHVSPNKTPELSVAGHALYSTHPNTLQLLKNWTTQNHRPFSMHLAENPGEIELFTTGRGEFADFLKKSLLPESFVPPFTTPIRYADQLGLLDHNTLAVHCVHANSSDIQVLAETNTSVCLCPRSNYNINLESPPWEEMLEAGISLCLGTDSLCSNFDLNLWKEVEQLLQTASREIHLQEIMKLLTINPARALGLDYYLGSLEPGKKGCFTLIPEEFTANIPI
ncbi:MAG: amidohydrolase family protein [Thermodesulfobacteriota bacterium]